MNSTIENPNSVPLPDDPNVLLDIPESKQELLSETEEEIEEWDLLTYSKLFFNLKKCTKLQ